jgi:L,D-peptidoglycan transpeptidase YkuD (ErfK/YbiS/YcfS/YnhG family)
MNNTQIVNQFNLDKNIRQIILVTAMSDSPTGYLYTFEKKADTWTEILENIPVVIGRSGMSANKIEGDGKSPLGLHKIGHAFGIGAKPKYVKMSYKEISAADKFIDDPESSQYNSWVRGETDAKSYERMKRKDELYDLGLVIEYNMHPVVANKGSAIFMHIWKSSSRGTEGCVAMKKIHLEDIMEWLDPEQNPHIYILES